MDTTPLRALVQRDQELVQDRRRDSENGRV
jgi:hypothetical protein